MLKGIDVSHYQGNINWERVKSHIDFAVIRCGYGSDITPQDDKSFLRNAAECKRLGIPYAVYLYSYADTKDKLASEIKHVLRLVKGLNPFRIYIDMEDKSTVKCGKKTLTEYALQFCSEIKKNGFNAGVYANEYWCNTYLDIAAIKGAGYSIWCAKYSSYKPNIKAEYDIWQYSSSGSVDGISGRVDMNYMYKDIRNIPVQPPKPVAPAQPKPAPSKPVTKNNAVLEWQKAAVRDGYKFPKYGTDGKWGGECEAVAKKAICKKQAVYRNKNLTRIIQVAVGVKVDGLFGNATRNAVIAYQRKKGVTADGIVGINTWKKILGI